MKEDYVMLECMKCDRQFIVYMGVDEDFELGEEVVCPYCQHEDQQAIGLAEVIL